MRSLIKHLDESLEEMVPIWLTVCVCLSVAIVGLTIGAML
jgi:hypothetical protein